MKIIQSNTNIRGIILMILLFVEMLFLHFLFNATLGNRESLIRIFNESPFQIFFGWTIICVLVVFLLQVSCC